MPQNDHERAIVLWLATKVCGWKRKTITVFRGCFQQEDRWDTGTGPDVECHLWNPLADTTLGKGQAMEVWEKAREMGVWVRLSGPTNARWHATSFPNVAEFSIYADSGPRAICEAIYRATGGEEKDAG